MDRQKRQMDIQTDGYIDRCRDTQINRLKQMYTLIDKIKALQEIDRNKDKKYDYQILYMQIDRQRYILDRQIKKRLPIVCLTSLLYLYP